MFIMVYLVLWQLHDLLSKVTVWFIPSFDIYMIAYFSNAV